jgi:hypothetical protein
MTAASPAELAFTLPREASPLARDLAAALCHETTKLGADASLHAAMCPPPRPGRTNVFIDLEQSVADGSPRPPADVLARSILISTTAPDHHISHEGLDLARESGAVYASSSTTLRRYRAEAVRAAELQLGFCELWAPLEEPPERNVDIAFIGALTARRASALAGYADILERFDCDLWLWDDLHPLLDTPDGAPDGAARRALMTRAKVLIAIHAGAAPDLDWYQVAGAVAAGCAVVTEHATDLGPLAAGEHLLSGRVGTLGLIAAALVEDHGERRRLVAAASAALSERRPLAGTAAELLATAAELERTAPATSARSEAQMQAGWLTGAPPGPRLLQPPRRLAATTAEAMILRELKAQRAILLALSRRLERADLARREPKRSPAPELVVETPAWTGAPSPQLTVAVPLYNHNEHVLDCLGSLAASTFTDWEVVVVDDGSTDGGGASVAAWMQANARCRGRLYRHAVNCGLSQARGTAVAQARGGLVLMLDSDNLVRRRGIERLVAALAANPGASFAYGIAEVFTREGPVWLASCFRWNPERLRVGNYVDAQIMIRRAALESVGGYSNDARLALGWEDYDLLVRLAEAGHSAVSVPEFVARYRVVRSGMTQASDLSHADAWAALADHAPELMRELEIPAL